jgi:hypothetical protein
MRDFSDRASSLEKNDDYFERQARENTEQIKREGFSINAVIGAQVELIDTLTSQMEFMREKLDPYLIPNELINIEADTPVNHNPELSPTANRIIRNNVLLSALSSTLRDFANRIN